MFYVLYSLDGLDILCFCFLCVILGLCLIGCGLCCRGVVI